MTWKAAIEEASRRMGASEADIAATSRFATAMIRAEEGARADFIFQDVALQPGQTEEDLVASLVEAFSNRAFVEQLMKEQAKKEARSLLN